MRREKGAWDFITPAEYNLDPAEQVQQQAAAIMLVQDGTFAHYAAYDQYGHLLSGTLYAHTTEGYKTATKLAEEHHGRVEMVGNRYFINSYGTWSHYAHWHSDHERDMQVNFQV